MAEESPSNRWWENYLVRYFLPSIVGMLIVAWLQQNTGLNRYITNISIHDWKDFDTSYLVLWLLIGSLYCYIASYPALVFHATRIIDFKDVEGRIWLNWRLIVNPFVTCILFAALGWGSYYLRSLSVYLSAIVVFLFMCIQIYRILAVSSTIGDFGLTAKVNAESQASIAYAYLRFLAERRGITKKTSADGKTNNNANKAEKMTKETEKEIVESYRHLREHGNTALIVLLEVALCPILCVIFGDPCTSRDRIICHNPQSDWLLSFVLVLWILPSVCIHGFAQHLEHRFSLFKCSIDAKEDPIPAGEVKT
jgi:hypothetical protein